MKTSNSNVSIQTPTVNAGVAGRPGEIKQPGKDLASEIIFFEANSPKNGEKFKQFYPPNRAKLAEDAKRKDLPARETGEVFAILDYRTGLQKLPNGAIFAGLVTGNNVFARDTENFARDEVRALAVKITKEKRANGGLRL